MTTKEQLREETMTKELFIKYYVYNREKQGMLTSLSQLYDRMWSEIEKRDNIILTQGRDLNQMVKTIARLGAEIKEAESGRETAP